MCRCEWSPSIWAVPIILALGLSAAHAQSKIGIASTARNQVERITAGGSRALSSGGDVFLNERVRTGEESQAQLVFLDETNLGVGPKSEVKLDRFVYNPDRGTGRVVVNAGRGVFRFVTGSQDPKNYTVKTPIATIGVRGTDFHLLVERDRIVVSPERRSRSLRTGGSLARHPGPGRLSATRATCRFPISAASRR